jgi:tetratricopeptide (TPR) repeat protein
MKGIVQLMLGLGISAIVSLNSSTPVWGQSADTYRRQGLDLRAQERYPEAIAALQKAVELDPNNLSGQVLLGWTQHRAGQHTEATTTLLQAFSLNPFAVPTLNALGIVYLVEGQLGHAIATHTWAALLKPNNEIAYYNLSLAFERIGQYEWAIAAAQAAAKLEPSNPHPLIAEAIGHAGNGDPARAKSVFKEAISLDSRYADNTFLNYLNEAGFSSDQITEAQAVLARLGQI